MDNVVLQIVFRYMHILSAIGAVGGLAFLTFTLLPSMKTSDGELREAVLTPAVRRFTRILWIAIAGLVISGVFNWMALAGTYKAMGPAGNALIGTKVLLALIFFALVWAESTGMIKPKRPRTMIVAKLHLGLVIVLLGSILRCLRLAYMGV